MYFPNLQTPCIYTCPSGHNHGTGYAYLVWKSYDPLAVSVSALDKFGEAKKDMLDENDQNVSTFWIARDTLHIATRSGRSLGCPVVGELEVKCQVIPQQHTSLAISWSRGFTMVVDRDILSAWIDRSYALVAAGDAENEIIDMNSIVKRILEKK